MSVEFTWIYLSVARLAACLCYGRQAGRHADRCTCLRACHTHRQAGWAWMQAVQLVQLFLI